jgi:AraC-like DNA-binding protein
VSSTPAGNSFCLTREVTACRRVAATRATHEQGCFAGLTIVAVPIVCGQAHVATLLAGHVLRRPLTPKALASVTERLNRWGGRVTLARVQKTYRAMPNITEKQWRGAVKLLEVFAKHLAEQSTGLLTPGDGAPQWVLEAQRFAREHSTERITMRDAARHVNLSRFHFCKMFRRFTGQTFTEYVARVRVRTAKDLLHNPLLLVVDVALQSGFGSVPQFNSVFRKLVGQSPRAYRNEIGISPQSTGRPASRRSD